MNLPEMSVKANWHWNLKYFPNISKLHRNSTSMWWIYLWYAYKNKLNGMANSNVNPIPRVSWHNLEESFVKKTKNSGLVPLIIVLSWTLFTYRCPECDGAGFIRKTGSALRTNAARKDSLQIVCPTCSGLGKLGVKALPNLPKLSLKWGLQFSSCTSLNIVFL